jgi:hypothetical protein
MNGVRKRDLPSKVCPVCRRPFAWRKKWARVWDEVRYCSERCRRSRASGGATATTGADRIARDSSARQTRSVFGTTD